MYRGLDKYFKDMERISFFDPLVSNTRIRGAIQIIIIIINE